MPQSNDGSMSRRSTLRASPAQTEAKTEDKASRPFGSRASSPVRKTLADSVVSQ